MHQHLNSLNNSLEKIDTDHIYMPDLKLKCNILTTSIKKWQTDRQNDRQINWDRLIKIGRQNGKDRATDKQTDRTQGSQHFKIPGSPSGRYSSDFGSPKIYLTSPNKKRP